MVLLSAYNVFLYRTTGTTDVVVMTFTSGRADADFHDTVGSFFNFLPLRTDLAGCADFREVVARTRRTCLDAYTHDIPFTDIVTQAPELMQTAVGDDAALCAFQVFRSPFPADGEAGDVRYAPVQRRLLSQDSGVDIPDGAMWHIDLGISGDFTGALSGSFGYNTNLFDGDRISGMIAGFGQVLTGVLADPAADIHGGQQ